MSNVVLTSGGLASAFVAFLVEDPRELMEERFNREAVPITRNRRPATILKQGGQPLSLRGFRERIEAGETSYEKPTYADYESIPCECGT